MFPVTNFMYTFRLSWTASRFYYFLILGSEQIKIIQRIITICVANTISINIHDLCVLIWWPDFGVEISYSVNKCIYRWVGCGCEYL